MCVRRNRTSDTSFSAGYIRLHQSVSRSLDSTWHRSWPIRLALRDLATKLGDQSPQQLASRLPRAEPHEAAQWQDVIRNLYYDPSGETAFSTYGQIIRKAKTLQVAVPSAVKPWLEQQDAYTLHKPVRKRFPRNPNTVSNILDLSEADLVDVQSLAKHNDGHRYLLTVIDVFTKYLHIVPLKSKTAKAVSESFETVLNEDKYRKPLKRRHVWVRTDKSKEFLGSSFQKLMKREGIQFLVCKNPDVKC